MPSSSRGEKFAQDFLVDQARKTAQPATFDMKVSIFSYFIDSCEESVNLQLERD